MHKTPVTHTHTHTFIHYDYILPNTLRRRDGESNTFAAALTMGMPLTLGLGWCDLLNRTLRRWCYCMTILRQYKMARNVNDVSHSIRDFLFYHAHVAQGALFWCKIIIMFSRSRLLFICSVHVFAGLARSLLTTGDQNSIYFIQLLEYHVFLLTLLQCHIS